VIIIFPCTERGLKSALQLRKYLSKQSLLSANAKQEANLSFFSRDYTHFFIFTNISLHNSVDLSTSPAIIRAYDGKYRMTLNWETTYALALELRRQHPEINIEEVSLQQIYQWTIQLSEFEDDLALVNDDILYAIYQDWFEENIHGK
jgi:FeS assembly protein IscX